MSRSALHGWSRRAQVFAQRFNVFNECGQRVIVVGWLGGAATRALVEVNHPHVWLEIRAGHHLKGVAALAGPAVQKNYRRNVLLCFAGYLVPQPETVQNRVA